MSNQTKIKEALLKAGVPAHLKGYHYLKTGIALVLENPEKLHATTKILYPEIAKKHGTTSSRVERAIRHAVEYMFDHAAPDLIEELFGNTLPYRTGKPTNSHFIATLVERLEEEECVCSSM